jgi:CMP-N-acetylneuraminic acid synthetase
MRHTSERVPGKNYRQFAGRPLFNHILETLIACPLISQIVIDTDSSIIKSDIATHFPSVTLIDRLESLRGGEVPMNAILLHDVSIVDADLYLQTHSTNPLLRTETISNAIQTFLKAAPLYDSLFSVTPIKVRLWDGLTRPINHNPSILLRTQDLPEIYEENSCLYLFTRSNLEKRQNRIGERPLMYRIDREEAWDIDEELDFHVAEQIYLKRLNEKE